MNTLNPMAFNFNSHQLNVPNVAPKTLNRVYYSQRLKTDLAEKRLTQKWWTVLQRLLKLSGFKIWAEPAQQRLERIQQQLESQPKVSVQENREEDYEWLLIQLSLDAIEDLEEVTQSV